ncbi:MAG: hypothetical protein HC780_11760 [Leptolyngbyaceae cyanobacterium CSU_1_3]|nr:hypothetical protein [Leptolyngbyaceae cyanobacterium CSU_1_3]
MDLGAIASGIVTTLLISGLFRLTKFTAQRPRRSRSVEPTPSRTYSYTQAPREPERPSTPASQTSKNPPSDWQEDASDWFDDDSSWGDEPTDNPTDRATDRPRSTHEPIRSAKPGPAYSYRYGDPETPKADTSKPVVDADFRVIVPPYRSPDPNDPGSTEKNR